MANVMKMRLFRLLFACSYKIHFDPFSCNKNVKTLIYKQYQIK